MLIKKYRKKPVVIEAVQWTGENLDEICAYCPAAYMDCETPTSTITLFIKTLEGRLRANDGDYIIKGVSGEFYPCKPDIFEKTYDEIAD